MSEGDRHVCNCDNCNASRAGFLDLQLHDQLRRARFHERENYARWKAAEARLAALDIRPWVPEDGDSRCKSCGRPNVVWFADNTIWNAVMGDEGGVLCLSCFALRGDEYLPRRPVWILRTEARA